MLLKTTLNHLNAETPLDTNAVAILIAPPLDERRFRREMTPMLPLFLSRLFGKRHHEFVQIGRLYYPNWEAYRQGVLVPLVPSINVMRETNAAIVPDATWRDFQKTANNPRFRAVFLVAHHISSVQSIEFADGARPISEVLAFLKTLQNRPEPLSLLFFVCQSDTLKNTIYGSIESVMSVGWSRWYIGWTDGMGFIAQWVNALKDNDKTLSEAYQITLSLFIKQLKNNQNDV
jgi:hypothetical protein